MKSRVTIEVDFESGNEPVLQILFRSSDDVRDRLIQALYQKLGSSSWMKIHFDQHYFDPMDASNDFKRISIRPIPELNLKEEAEIMLEQHRVRVKYEEMLKSSPPQGQSL